MGGQTGPLTDIVWILIRNVFMSGYLRVITVFRCHNVSRMARSPPRIFVTQNSPCNTARRKETSCHPARLLECSQGMSLLRSRVTNGSLSCLARIIICCWRGLKQRQKCSMKGVGTTSVMSGPQQKEQRRQRCCSFLYRCQVHHAVLL